MPSEPQELERPVRPELVPSLAWLWITLSLVGLILLAGLIFAIGGDDY